MKLTRVRERTQLLVSFLSLQALAQVFSVLAGLFIVRTLPIKEFAVYTLVTALQATFAVLTDNGISAMVIARAGNLYSDRARLAQLVASSRQMRRRLEVIILLVGAPILWIWLRDRGIPPWEYVGLGVVLAWSLHFQVAASIFGSVPLVLLEVRKVQFAQLAGAVVRLGLLGGTLGSLPRALPALCANTLGVGAQAWLARRYAAEHIDLTASANVEDLQRIKTMVRSQLFNSLYYAFSSQLTVWLVGFAGTTRAIAEVGALGRLGSIIVLGQSALSMLVGPRLARIPTVVPFRRRYLTVLLLTIVGAGSLVLLSIFEPSVFLWILGPAYSGLRVELPLAIGSAAIYLVSSTVFALNTSKAWIERAWVAVPMIIVVQAASLLIFNVSVVRGALLFGLFSAIPPLLVNSSIAAIKMVKWARQASRAQ